MSGNLPVLSQPAELEHKPNDNTKLDLVSDEIKGIVYNLDLSVDRKETILRDILIHQSKNGIPVVSMAQHEQMLYTFRKSLSSILNVDVLCLDAVDQYMLLEDMLTTTLDNYIEHIEKVHEKYDKSYPVIVSVTHEKILSV